MHTATIIAAILDALPDLSDDQKQRLEAQLKSLILADRRCKLGEMQMEFALNCQCSGCRLIIDKVMLDNADIQKIRIL